MFELYKILDVCVCVHVRVCVCMLFVHYRQHSGVPFGCIVVSISSAGIIATVVSDPQCCGPCKEDQVPICRFNNNAFVKHLCIHVGMGSKRSFSIPVNCR